MLKPSPETSATSSPKSSRPTTRSSIRQSLNLAGKALVDVINKESKDADKIAKKGKGASSHHLAAITAKPTAPRMSLGDVKSSLHPARAQTPDSKTVARKRLSAHIHPENQPTRTSENTNSGCARGPTLRPRTAAGSGSALPKYRPRSIVADKPPSPKTGSRRPLISSEDEQEDKNRVENYSPLEKISRPISPLPHRAALKISTAMNTNATPPATPTKPLTSSRSKTSPQRPSKIVKTGTSTSTVTATSIPRPPSSSSSASSFTPNSPQTPQVKSVTAIRRAAQSSPCPASAQGSLLSRTSRSKANASPSPSRTPVAGNMSHISEVNSEDSDGEEDVALLLAPVASIGAPTPAMPRITRKAAPRTPARSNFLPSRENMSYVSPLPSASDSTGRSSLRPPPANGSSGKQGRGSILSWEQLASEASKTLGEGELESMLADMQAPFQPGLVSPALSTLQLDIPESPCLSALNSPGGYGSISQVLLPDVTPSPAVHPHMLRYDITSEAPRVDSGTVTMLRLQLAAADNLAKERLSQLQALEEEVHNLKMLRGREAQDLMKQVVHMEEQLQGSLRIHEQADEERLACISELKAQLRHAREHHDQAVKEAMARCRKDIEKARDVKWQTRRARWEVDSRARVAKSEWESVRSFSEMELDLVQSDRQVLSILLRGLDELSFQSI